MLILTGIPDRAPTAAGPSVLQLRGHDAARSSRDQIVQGGLKDEGERTTDGGDRVRHLVGVTHPARFLTQTLIYDVDPKTFAPVRGSVTYKDSRRGPPTTMMFSVSRYERLPDTGANARLLRMSTTPTAKITRRPALLPNYLRK